MKKKTKKLSLCAETLRNLSAAEGAMIRAGEEPDPGSGSCQTCGLDTCRTCYACVP